MNKLAVNLLPTDLLEEKKQNLKFDLLRKVSFGVLVFVVILGGATVALRLTQQSALNSANDRVSNDQNQVLAMSDKDSQAWLIKDRLTSIEGILGGDQKRKQIYSLIMNLLPPGMQVTDLSLDKSNNLIISLNTTSLADMDALFHDLADQSKNQNLISLVDFDGLSMGKDNVYRFTLKIKTN
ncbi:hypothetical protein M1563_02655 [Patescibacteria group bacterium]|nr:hypothetical protein [Patescibacteria group bacterium]MCL5409945.1 hypothetical protein [Patescibacteria group bacterium]